MTVCPMCGTEYDGSKTAGCSGCPMGNSCAMACCPRCGYKLPGESRLGKLIKRLSARGGADEHAGVAAKR